MRILLKKRGSTTNTLRAFRKVEIAASPALQLLNKIDAVPLLIYKGGVYRRSLILDDSPCAKEETSID